MSRRRCGSGAFLLFYSAFRQGRLVHIFDASSSVRRAVVFQRIKKILTKLMSLKDSDNLRGAHFTPASVRCALKGKILFMRCVKNSQIEFRIVANLQPHLTSSDLTWPGRFTAILSSYQKFLGLSQYTSDPVLTGSQSWPSWPYDYLCWHWLISGQERLWLRVKIGIWLVSSRKEGLDLKELELP